MGDAGYEGQVRQEPFEEISQQWPLHDEEILEVKEQTHRKMEALSTTTGSHLGLRKIFSRRLKAEKLSV